MVTTRVNASDGLKGRHVIDTGGVDVGVVEDVEIDTATWGVRGLVVKVHRDVADRLPVQKPLVGDPRIAFSTERVRSFGDAVLLNVGIGEVAATLSGP